MIAPRPPAGRWTAAAVAVLLAAAPLAAADAKPLDPAVLKKVKAATALVTAELSRDRVSRGTGFCVDAPGLVVTNAHVLDMLDADSPKPTKVEVTLTDAAGATRTLEATVLGVDRGTDLALLKVADKSPPPVLPLGKAAGVQQTDQVYVFGYPFGDKLGKEVTVGKSSVSSLRKAGSAVAQVQLDGGLNPGNSGGPVVNEKGQVIGVAVSGIRGSGIGFAIPAESVARFLNGRVVFGAVGVPFLDGKAVKLPVTLELVDPLGRLKKVEVETWVGDPGPARAPGNAEPPALPTDSKKVRTDMRYDQKAATLKMDVPADRVTDPKKVYWYRPVVTDRTGTMWVAGTPHAAILPAERVPVTFKYDPPAAHVQTAELCSFGAFRMRAAGEEHAIEINLKPTFEERYGEAVKGRRPVALAVSRAAANYLQDGKPVRDTPIARALPDLPAWAGSVVAEADGEYAGGRADLRRVPAGSQAGMTMLSDQLLQSVEFLSVALPAGEVKPLTTWKARRPVTVGTGFAAIEAKVDMEYTYGGVQTRDGRKVALIELNGVVRSADRTGPEVTGRLSGSAVVALDTGETLYSSAALKAEMEFEFDRQRVKMTGTTDLSIVRPAPAPRR